MKHMNPSLKSILLFLPILLLLGFASCDSDDNMIVPDSEAQEPEAPAPELGMEAFCPCFNLDDIVNAGDQADSIECGNIVFGLALIPNNSGPFASQCMESGMPCECENGINVMDIDTDEYAACINILLNGLIQINSENLKITGCASN